MFFLIINIALLLALVIFLLSFIFHFLSIVLKGQAPYIMSQPEAVRRAVAELDLVQESILAYELGSGDAPFLRRLVKKFPQARAMGVEHSLVPYVLAKLVTLFNKRIEITKKNFYKIDLSQADLIYCYLNIDSMAKLEKKFLAEAKDGLLVVSYNFPLPTVEPYKVLRIHKMPLYFYKISQDRK
ncbi:MAG: hypothetical protein C3F02_00525 [Parcubacteria group bacterium]|nr:MAG: hypothetical protein C3F02_00525 [Parcubacteria group bacterium]